MNTIEEIISAFQGLPPEDKNTVIRKLMELNPAITIPDFAQLMQRMYRKNISFSIATEMRSGKPFITAVVNTPMGDFKGHGSNSTEAKKAAVQVAFDFFNNNVIPKK